MTLNQSGEQSVGRADVSPLEQLYRQYAGPIYRFLYRKIGTREEAEDLTSLIFLKVVRKLDRGRTREAMQYWLLQITRTCLADYRRSHSYIALCSLEAKPCSRLAGKALVLQG